MALHNYTYKILVVSPENLDFNIGILLWMFQHHSVTYIAVSILDSEQPSLYSLCIQALPSWFPCAEPILNLREFKHFPLF